MEHPTKNRGRSRLRRLFRLGIRQKVALVLFVTLFITLTGSGWLALQSQGEDILRETRFRGTELAHFIAQSLANSVVGYDYHTIELWLQEAAKNEDIAYVKVISARGNTMAESGTPPERTGHIALFSEDIRVNSEVVGKLVLGLSTERIAQTLAKQKSSYIKRESIVILLLVIIEFIVISYLILRPITRISDVMSVAQSAEEDCDGPLAPDDAATSSGSPVPDPAMTALPVRTRDEIGDLARNFLNLQERRQHAIAGLRRSERKNRALVNAMPDMMLRLSRDGVCLDCKIPRQLPATLMPERMVGKHILESMPTDIGNTLLEHLNRAFATQQIQIFHYSQEAGGKTLDFEARITVGTDDEAMAIVRDITEQRHMEERIHFLAHFDSLTQLPNRLLFKERLHTAIERERHQDKTVAVIHMDLDNFKIINDTLGHDAGDLLLQGVAERLQRMLRTSDYITRQPQKEPGAVLSRSGGDEFTVLLTHIADAAAAMQAARRILETLSQPFRISGHEIGVTASLGIALFPNDGADAETLIKNADTAMNHAKDEGRNSWRFYTQAMNNTLSRRLTLENRLRRAIENKELRLYYQPQVEIASGRISGVESLMRWTHPDLGTVSPAEFIPIAEDTGLILPIGAWALREACAQNRAWSRLGFDLRVAVNISGVQFRQPGFVALVRETLHDTGLPAHRLEIELTEGVLMRNNEEILQTLREIKALGVHLSIDDFGTGYSSLSYLKRFPLDTLKIDRSFVCGLPNDSDDAAISSAIIAMAHALKFQVVAEGVENEAQLAFLRLKDCDLIQGYLISAAVPAETLVAMLDARQPPIVASARNRSQ
ncbi:MAG: EAL domain-containing protein [Sulfuricaulis sp.]|nr:EAL domain-containing protein [Sulfuricaulis sp.]